MTKVLDVKFLIQHLPKSLDVIFSHMCLQLEQILNEKKVLIRDISQLSLKLKTFMVCVSLMKESCGY